MKALLTAVLLGGALALAGCDAASDQQGSATVRVHLTDFPYDLVAEANVTIVRIEMIRAGGGVELIAAFDDPPEFNLLELQDGVTAFLAESVIPGGTYNQLRIVVGDEAEVVLVQDPTDPDPPQTFNLHVPSGTETGVKINLPQLVIEEDGELIEIVADFNVEESFVVQGNPNTPAGITGFIFRPVLALDRLEVNGEVVVE